MNNPTCWKCETEILPGADFKENPALMHESCYYEEPDLGDEGVT